MPLRVEVKPELIAWARERSGLTLADLSGRFPKIGEWERGDRAPTVKQLDRLAQATHTPVGFFYLDEPPSEQVPIPDFRTMGNASVSRPSPNLLDTIYQCEQRQEWYRDFARLSREDPLEFVGSLDLETPIVRAASAIRAALNFEVDARGPTWTDALRRLIEHAEDLGALVMVSGVVGSNTHRKLDPREFRGFALVDDLAPLVFVNGADTRAAQIFTLAHELAHLWLGETGLSDVDLAATPTIPAERWCNQVAAEMLVPEQAIALEFGHGELIADELDRLARRFKVSTLVVLRRVYDADFLTWDRYQSAYSAELERILEILSERERSGGNFFNTQPIRVSKRFTRAVITSTLEGQTLYSDAFAMLGFKKLSTFRELAGRLGVG